MGQAAFVDGAGKELLTLVDTGCAIHTPRSNPPALAVALDGHTLELLPMVGTAGYELDKGEYVEEARAAAIVASDFVPAWIVTTK